MSLCFILGGAACFALAAAAFPFSFDFFFVFAFSLAFLLLACSCSARLSSVEPVRNSTAALAFCLAAALFVVAIPVVVRVYRSVKVKMLFKDFLSSLFSSFLFSLVAFVDRAHCCPLAAVFICLTLAFHVALS